MRDRALRHRWPLQIDFSSFGRSVHDEALTAHMTGGRDATVAAGVSSGTPAKSAYSRTEGSPVRRDYGIGSMAGGTAGREFRAAVESQTGHSVPHAGGDSPVLSSLRGVPQPVRVRKLARELNALFNELDNGRIPVDVFREELRAMGLHETMETARLLRAPGPISFAQVFRALCTEDDPAAVAAFSVDSARSRPATSSVVGAVMAPAGPSGSRRGVSSGGGSSSADVFGRGPLPGRTSGKRMYDRPATSGSTRDVVAWRESDDSHGRVSEWSTARMSNIDNHGHSVAREDKGYMEETGAGALVRGQGDLLEAGVTSDDAIAPRSKGALRLAPGTTESKGVAAALTDRVVAVDSLSRFESVTSANARMGLGGNVASAVPVTSAGYQSRAGDILRQQLYSLVRQLDAASIDVWEFRARVARLGIEIPASAEKLIADFCATGKADFGKFVRAFDVVIAALPIAAPDEPAPPPTEQTVHAEPEDYPEVSGPRSARLEFGRGHGDIISWQNSTLTQEEENESMRLAGLRPGMSRSHNLWSENRSSRDIVSWQEAQAPLMTSSALPESRKGRGPRHIAQRRTGDFLSWDADPTGPEVGHTIPTKHSSGRRAPGGSVPPSPGHDMPYGTEADMHPESRPPSARVISPTMRPSAQWMTYSSHE
jgi:hypothetical protein